MNGGERIFWPYYLQNLPGIFKFENLNVIRIHLISKLVEFF